MPFARMDACDLISFDDAEVVFVQAPTPLPAVKESKPPNEDKCNDLILFENEQTPPPTDKPRDDKTTEKETELDPNDLLLKEIVQQGVSQSELEKKPYTASFDTLSLELQKFITELAEFFTEKINYKRKEIPISMTTMTKNIQRIKGFIGYCQKSGADFTVSKFNDLELIEEYVGYLQVSRAVTASTAVNHLVALTYPIKFMNKSLAPNYTNCIELLSVRELMRYLSKEDARRKHETESSMKAESKWEEWPKIVAAVKRFEGDSYGSSKREKSRYQHDLLLLHLFTVLPPGRSAEYRSLRFMKKDEVLEESIGNFLFLNDQEEFEMNLQSYKTGKFYGAMPVRVPPGSILERSIKEYLNNGRPNLLASSAEDTVFLTRTGKKFSEPAFCMYIQRLWKRVVGKPLGVCALRSSFVTFAYEKQVDPAVKESIAFNMRHTEREAKRTYDKRSKRKRSEAGIEFARSAYVELEDVMDGRENEQSFQAGDFVTINSKDGDGGPKVARVLGRSIGTRYLLLLYSVSKGGREIKLADSFGKFEMPAADLRLVEAKCIQTDTYRVKGRRII